MWWCGALAAVLDETCFGDRWRCLYAIGFGRNTLSVSDGSPLVVCGSGQVMSCYWNLMSQLRLQFAFSVFDILSPSLKSRCQKCPVYIRSFIFIHFNMSTANLREGSSVIQWHCRSRNTLIDSGLAQIAWMCWDHLKHMVRTLCVL